MAQILYDSSEADRADIAAERRPRREVAWDRVIPLALLAGFWIAVAILIVRYLNP
jgi:hypothetical protein